MDEKDKKPTESAPVETDKKKISIKPGQKNQIIINPPEKPPVKNVNELFSSARQKHAVVLEKKIELVLHAKAKQADLPEEALRQVYVRRSEEHTSELQSPEAISYAVFCLKKKRIMEQQ